MQRLLLIFTVLVALLIGYATGYRARISEEHINVYPYPMRPHVPDDLT